MNVANDCQKNPLLNRVGLVSHALGDRELHSGQL
jgi:hypothetical protein